MDPWVLGLVAPHSPPHHAPSLRDERPFPCHGEAVVEDAGSWGPVSPHQVVSRQNAFPPPSATTHAPTPHTPPMVIISMSCHVMERKSHRPLVHPVGIHWENF